MCLTVFWSNFDFFEGAYGASKREGESICGAQVQMLSALLGPKSSLLADGYHKKYFCLLYKFYLGTLRVTPPSCCGRREGRWW